MLQMYGIWTIPRITRFVSKILKDICLVNNKVTTNFSQCLRFSVASLVGNASFSMTLHVFWESRNDQLRNTKGSCFWWFRSSPKSSGGIRVKISPQLECDVSVNRHISFSSMGCANLKLFSRMSLRFFETFTEFSLPEIFQWYCIEFWLFGGSPFWICPNRCWRKNTSLA